MIYFRFVHTSILKLIVIKDCSLHKNCPTPHGRRAYRLNKTTLYFRITLLLTCKYTKETKIVQYRNSERTEPIIQQGVCVKICPTLSVFLFYGFVILTALPSWSNIAIFTKFIGILNNCSLFYTKLSHIIEEFISNHFNLISLIF